MRPTGDEEFAALFRAEYGPVLRVASLLLADRHRAEEVAQEAFMRLYARWAKVSRYDKPGAWVRRVAINLALNRRAARSESSLEGVAHPAVADPDLPDEQLRAAILRLPRAQRAAVVLHYLEDRPVAEVAEILGCRDATAKVHLHRARARLAELLGQEAVDVVG